MFEYTRAVLDKTIKELSYVSYISSIIFQFFYVAFLIGSLAFGLGIIAINIILLVASIAYLVLRIVSHKTDFKNEEKVACRAIMRKDSNKQLHWENQIVGWAQGIQ